MRAIAGLVAGLLATAPAASGAETLADAWTAALHAHQRVAAAEAQRDAAVHGLDGARAERWPQVGVTTAYTRLDSAPRFAFGDASVSPPIFSGDDFVMTSAQLSLPLFTSGAVTRGIDAAESRVSASRRELDTVSQDIKLGTAERFIDVLRAESALNVARSNVKTLESHTADAANRYRLGAVPHNHLLAASVTLADAKQRELQASNRVELARAAYNRWLGRDLSAAVVLDPRLPLDALVPPGGNVDALIAVAIAERHELATLQARAEALRARADVARAQSRPQLALTGGYSRLETEFLDDDEFWMFGIALRWNLFDSGRTESRASALAREAEAALHERRDLESLIRLQVQQAWLDRQEAVHRRAVAGAAVDQAAENLRVVRDRYQAGAGTNTEVLDAEALRAKALSNRDNARFDIAFATLRLARATGTL